MSGRRIEACHARTSAIGGGGLLCAMRARVGALAERQQQWWLTTAPVVSSRSCSDPGTKGPSTGRVHLIEFVPSMHYRAMLLKVEFVLLWLLFEGRRKNRSHATQSGSHWAPRGASYATWKHA